MQTKVVSTKVVPKSGPVMKLFKAFKGACVSPIFIIIGFVLVFYSQTFAKDSQIVSSLELQTADEVSADAGMVKIEGEADITTPVQAPEIGDVLYYEYEIQRYEEVEKIERETITEIENGQEVEKVIETTELVEEWVDVQDADPTWASFRLDEIEIEASKAKNKSDLETKTFWENFLGDYEEEAANTNTQPSLGDMRMIVKYLETDEELIVVGEVDNNTIDSGEPFIITNKSEADLIQSLESSESAIFWGTKVGAWVFFTMGIMSILGPVLTMADFIPFAGKVANTIAGFVAAIVSLLIVVVSSILVEFWWLLGICLLLVVGLLIGFLIYKVMQK